MKKKATAKRPHYKTTATKPIGNNPKVMAHPKGPKAPKGHGKAITGKVSSHFDKHIPVHGKKGGKTAASAQENPFSAGEVIHYGFSK